MRRQAGRLEGIKAPTVLISGKEPPCKPGSGEDSVHGRSGLGAAHDWWHGTGGQPLGQSGVKSIIITIASIVNCVPVASVSA